MSRRLLDDYPTHEALLLPLLGQHDRYGGMLVRGRVLEPCAGDGQLSRTLERAGLDVVTNDINPVYCTDYHYDMTVQKNWFSFGRFDWVVSNPPYTASILEPVLQYSLAYATCGVAMLLRVTALEPVVKKAQRGRILQLYADNLRHLMIFSDPRPRYDPTKKGTDSATTAWLVWDKGWSWKQEGIEPPFKFITGWLR